MNSKVENASLVSAHHGSRSLVSLNEAHVAQLVEHVLGKDEVTRSIRVVGSSYALLGRIPLVQLRREQ